MRYTLTKIDRSYFFTDHRWQQFEDAKAKKSGPMLDHDGGAAESKNDKASTEGSMNSDYKFGTEV